MLKIKPRRGCHWPMWPHGNHPTHEYCDEKRSQGSSYCAEHRAKSIRDLDIEPRQPFIPRRKAA
ncbi:uncharacterized protein METZ01_LOCUS273843 [marine metagenome]|uniref:GcrA cell cycle regulator n=1 Tax=marine metagenome TaxID=408172 RepID=A0A382K9W2_9ZZZZ